MNVKANLAVLQIPELEQLYIAPSCGDESNSIGAAIIAAVQAGEAIGPMPAPYLGPSITNEEADQALQGHRLRVRYCRNIEDLAAEAVANGHIVARANGPMEFGARALGNRSILARADSATADLKSTRLNSSH